MPKTCLLIIDPQKDFIDCNSSYAKRHKGVTQILDAKERINSLLASGKEDEVVIITSDYQTDQFEKGLSVCIPGTEGHAIDLDLAERYTVISKTQHSCFSSTRFIDHLKKHQVKKLVIGGFLAEYCVKQTAIDALENGYEVLLLKNCIGTADDVQDRKEQMLSLLSSKGAGIAEAWPQITPP